MLQADATDALVRDLLPIASIVTPNIPEAEVLADMAIVGVDDMRTAAVRIAEHGPGIVVIKGGHLEGPPVDLVYDGGEFTLLEGTRVETDNTHGTGCTFSAAITALLAQGSAPTEAISLAKLYVEAAIRSAQPIGKGHSPVNHAVDLPDEVANALLAFAR